MREKLQSRRGSDSCALRVLVLPIEETTKTLARRLVEPPCPASSAQGDSAAQVTALSRRSEARHPLDGARTAATAPARSCGATPSDLCKLPRLRDSAGNSTNTRASLSPGCFYSHPRSLTQAPALLPHALLLLRSCYWRRKTAKPRAPGLSSVVAPPLGLRRPPERRAVRGGRPGPPPSPPSLTWTAIG